MSNPTVRRPAPPKPLSAAPMAGLTPTTVDTPDGPKAALVVDGTEPLPPPGDERREVLAARKESLEERLAAIEAELGLDSSAAGVNPLVARKVDREIAAVYDHTRVINPEPGYAYYWANERSAHGIDVITHKTNGWKVVGSDSGENPDDKDVRGYRVVGDVILMRIPLAQYDILMARAKAARDAMVGSVDQGLSELGRRVRGRINISDLNPHQLQRLATAAAAQQMAGSITESRLRNGTVPGLTRRS